VTILLAVSDLGADDDDVPAALVELTAADLDALMDKGFGLWEAVNTTEKTRAVFKAFIEQLGARRRLTECPCCGMTETRYTVGYATVSNVEEP
jgi:hypothetical protein